MMMRATSVAFRSKLVYPCKRAVVLLVFKCKLLRKRRSLPSSIIRPPSLRACRAGSRKIASALISAFRGSKNNKMDQSVRDDDQLDSMNNPDDVLYDNKERERLLQLLPTPLLTPPSSRCRSRTLSKASPLAGVRDDLHEDACRSFENYLVEMIVEEGRVRDLMDVEELLFCWKNLKCPVFIDLVSRFYGELCKDLFATAASEHGGDISTP